MSAKINGASGRPTLDRIASLFFVILLVSVVVLLFTHISSAFAMLSASS